MSARQRWLLGLGAVLLLALIYAALVVRDALAVAVGYSAKQLCSGVLVAGLPAAFVIERDIEPRMDILGPLRGALTLQADVDRGYAEARLLGVAARAVSDPQQGCTLHATGDGAAPPRPAAAGAVGVRPPFDVAVQRAFAEPAAGGRNTLALLVSRAGELLVERYAAPVDAATRLQGWSMNKSLVATWVALQTARGDLDPGAAVADLLPPGEIAEGIDPSMTLNHLLQMESGLDFVERYGPGSDVTHMLYRSEAMWTLPATREQAYPPGTHFSYSSGDTVLATSLWQRSLDRPYFEWINEHFSEPLGITSLIAEPDASGRQVGSSFAYLTARDWLRVGQLWLDAWHGRSPLLSQAWMREAVSPRPSDARGRYGRGFWLNTGGVAFDGLPETLFYAGGNAGQYVIVIPEWELVVARFGLTAPDAGTGTGDFLRDLAAELALAP